MSNFDEALERFHLAGLEYSNGLSNHGPMGIEALEGLRHQALIPAFLDLYVPRLPPAEPGTAIDPAAEESALGRAEWGADWVATYDAKLARGDWRAVLSNALPTLLPGMFAAAGHGMLRTVHAVRSLEREDSPLRRRELARGLAHWSARFQRLPGLPGSQPGPLDSLSAFFESLPQIGTETTRGTLFFQAARALEDERAFRRAVEGVARPAAGEEVAFLRSLCLAGCQLYLARPDARIAYVHAVTIPSGLETLQPYIEDPDQRTLAALCALQCVAAIHAIQEPGDTPGAEPGEVPGEVPDEEVRSVSRDWNEIRYRAACSIQEHAIKMAEACFRQDQASPDPAYALAAADAAVRLEGTRSAGGC